MAIYGYARCSTDERHQDIERQRRELLSMGVEDDSHIYWEYQSGTRKDRPEFQKLLAILQSGDTLIATEVSRLTRSTQQLCDLLQLIQDRHLRLQIGGFTVDCVSDQPDPMTKGMMLMWGVFAEMERDMASERIRSGIANAKAKGKKIGHPKLRKRDLPHKFWVHYDDYKAKRLTLTDLAKLVGVARPTIYRYIAVAEDKR